MRARLSPLAAAADLAVAMVAAATAATAVAEEGSAVNIAADRTDSDGPTPPAPCGSVGRRSGPASVESASERLPREYHEMTSWESAALHTAPWGPYPPGMDQGAEGSARRVSVAADPRTDHPWLRFWPFSGVEAVSSAVLRSELLTPGSAKARSPSRHTNDWGEAAGDRGGRRRNH